MRRWLLSILALTVILAGVSFGQGPLQNALNMLVRTDANGSLYVYGVAAGAQGPLNSLGNMQLRTWGSNSALGVTIAGGAITPDTLCISSTTQDSYITEAILGANNPGVYSGGTACAGGTLRWDWNASRLNLSSAYSLNWADDLKLFRDAANTLAQRNGTNQQTFNLYGSFTDASNYDRIEAVADDTNSVYYIRTRAAGTGTIRPLAFGVGGQTDWRINTSHHFVSDADNTYDIGASGATRPRTGYFGTSVVVPTVNATTAYQFGGVNGVGFAFTQAEPVDQTARSSSGGTFVMTGLGAAAAPCTITPTSTGRVLFVITGDIVNNTTATTVSIKMAESTGSAPANNAAATGTVISRTIVTNAVTSVLTTPFTITGIKTGLALATAVWYDLQLTTSGANTGQPTNIDCTAHEI